MRKENESHFLAEKRMEYTEQKMKEEFTKLLSTESIQNEILIVQTILDMLKTFFSGSETIRNDLFAKNLMESEMII